LIQTDAPYNDYDSFHVPLGLQTVKENRSKIVKVKKMQPTISLKNSELTRRKHSVQLSTNFNEQSRNDNYADTIDPFSTCQSLEKIKSDLHKRRGNLGRSLSRSSIKEITSTPQSRKVPKCGDKNSHRLSQNKVNPYLETKNAEIYLVNHLSSSPSSRNLALKNILDKGKTLMAHKRALK
jgi:hypothetical protein